MSALGEKFILGLKKAGSALKTVGSKLASGFRYIGSKIYSHFAPLMPSFISKYGQQMVGNLAERAEMAVPGSGEHVAAIGSSMVDDAARQAEIYANQRRTRESRAVAIPRPSSSDVIRQRDRQMYSRPLTVRELNRDVRARRFMTDNQVTRRDLANAAEARQRRVAQRERTRRNILPSNYRGISPYELNTAVGRSSSSQRLDALADYDLWRNQRMGWQMSRYEPYTGPDFRNIL